MSSLNKRLLLNIYNFILLLALTFESPDKYTVDKDLAPTHQTSAAMSSEAMASALSRHLRDISY